MSPEQSTTLLRDTMTAAVASAENHTHTLRALSRRVAVGSNDGLGPL